MILYVECLLELVSLQWKNMAAQTYVMGIIWHSRQTNVFLTACREYILMQGLAPLSTLYELCTAADRLHPFGHVCFLWPCIALPRNVYCWRENTLAVAISACHLCWGRASCGIVLSAIMAWKGKFWIIPLHEKMKLLCSLKLELKVKWTGS